MENYINRLKNNDDSLVKLNSFNKRIYDNGVIAISKSLKVNTTLPDRLKPISGCDIPFRNITSSEIILDNFSGTSGMALQKLNIYDNNIDEME